MLKSIVNGAEHDIISIPMKGKNWLNIKDGTKTINNVVWTAYHGSITAQGTTTAVSESDAIIVYDGIFTRSGNYLNYCKIQASKSIKPPAGTYTFSANANPSGDERIALIVGDNDTYFANSTARKIAVGQTFSVNGNEYVMLVVSSIISLNQYNFADIMLNAGSTALPYEPYGYQNGWEVRDNQNRLIWGREDELQTTTGTLPFKGYDLPVKVKSLLGNTFQNGTPAPDNIVTPEMCGVRTGNLFDKSDTNLIFTGTSLATANEWYGAGGIGKVIRIPCNPSTTYTISGESDSNIFRISMVENEDTPVLEDGVVCIDVLKATSVSTQTFTTTANTKYILVQVSASAFDDYINVLMLNSGSTALPYEPYGWKVPFENHGENLLDSTIEQGSFRIADGTESSSTTRVRSTFMQSALPAGTYTINASGVDDVVIYAYTTNSTSGYDNSKSTTSWKAMPYTFTTENSLYLRFAFRKHSEAAVIPSEVSNAMLSPGSTPKPYSPYLNETIPVYLGEVPTVRRVRKLVLDGTENWYVYTDTSAAGVYRLELNGYLRVNTNISLSTHFETQSSVEGTTQVNEKSIAFLVSASGNNYMYIKYSDIQNVADFKSYLASEYAAGHPVTIWYVLANEQTGIVNEPLAKIGTYADELNDTVATLPEIPTTTGQNTLTVDTDLAPSNLTVKGHIKQIQ